MFERFKQMKDGRIELLKAKGDKIVAIADNGHGIVPRFEEAQGYVLVVVRNGKKVQRQIMNRGEESREELVKILSKLKVDAVIARDFMPRSMAKMKKYRMKLYFFDGGPHAAYQAWLRGELREV